MNGLDKTTSFVGGSKQNIGSLVTIFDNNETPRVIMENKIYCL